jgi:hypothetical protein
MNMEANMKRIYVSVLICIGVFILSGLNPLSAHSYEVGFRVLNDGGYYKNIPIEIRERDGGLLLDDFDYRSSGSGTYNFQIDLNTNDCTVYRVCLEVGKVYVISFDYGGSTGEKALYYTRDFLQCNPTSNDTFYTVTPSSVERYDDNPCWPEEVWGYPDAIPYYPLTLSLQVIDEKYVGDKITFTLRATAGGGDQNYNFSWTNAYPDVNSTPTTNPNIARRTILSTQRVTVSVTVTSNGDSVTRSKTLRGDI